ncbi:MAG: hypothetical protein HY293_22460 [Planctomycetes bacterium]|nr:hypothetical protein [Planctomycetota bacterium]
MGAGTTEVRTKHSLIPALLISLASALPARAQGDVDRAQADVAIRKGIAFLKANNAAALQLSDIVGRKMSPRELVLYAYASFNLPETDPDFKTLLDDVLKDKLEATYCVALQAMALEEIDRVKYQKRIAMCAQFLVDNQNPFGSWSYGSPSIYVEDLAFDVPRKGPVVPPPAPGAKDQPGLRVKQPVRSKIAVKKSRDGEGGSLSNTHYAILGMRACVDAGIQFEVKYVDLSIKHLRDSQKNDRVGAEPLVESNPGPKPKTAAPLGWCYMDHADHKAYGSMTAAMTGSLAALDYIKDADGGKKQTWKRDPDVHEGLQWLAKNFSASYNPGPFELAKMEENSKNEYYYYLHALSGVGLMYGTEVLGTHKWYSEGARELLAQQGEDGRWGRTLADTCHALLFLMRATRWLSPP